MPCQMCYLGISYHSRFAMQQLSVTGFLLWSPPSVTSLSQHQKGSWKSDLDGSNPELLNLNLKTAHHCNKQNSFYIFTQAIIKHIIYNGSAKHLHYTTAMTIFVTCQYKALQVKQIIQ